MIITAQDTLGCIFGIVPYKITNTLFMDKNAHQYNCVCREHTLIIDYILVEYDVLILTDHSCY